MNEHEQAMHEHEQAWRTHAPSTSRTGSGPWSDGSGVLTDGRDVIGYEVKATDGKIGRIDGCTTVTDRDHVVVDTGFWIFGKRRLLPAGLIRQIDHDEQRVWLRVGKDQVRGAPDYEEPEADFGRDHLQAHEEFFSRMDW